MNTSVKLYSIDQQQDVRWVARFHITLTLCSHLLFLLPLGFEIYVHSFLGYWYSPHENVPFIPMLGLAYAVTNNPFVILFFGLILPIVWCYLAYKLWWNANCDLWTIVKRLLICCAGYVTAWLYYSLDPLGFWHWFNAVTLTIYGA
jgi:hypothetical protein